MRGDDPLAATVERACNGDASAVEALVLAVQDSIYGLALRMLWCPEDAQDATQEILIRIVTRLSSFRGESAFKSWCFAVAVNYLRSAKRSRMEEMGYTFERFAEELHEPAPQNDSLQNQPEYGVALEEVRIGCTLGMLLCLGRDERLAYIVGEILECNHTEAATILEISPAAFRQRLARARKALTAFTKRVCGIVDERNDCRCSKRVPHAVSAGRIRLGKPLFSALGGAQTHSEVTAHVRQIEVAQRTVALYQNQPQFRAPDRIRKILNDLVDTRHRQS